MKARPGYCPFCKTEKADTSCTLRGIWKVGSTGADKRGEKRFKITPCLKCWDEMQEYAWRTRN